MSHSAARGARLRPMPGRSGTRTRPSRTSRRSTKSGSSQSNHSTHPSRGCAAARWTWSCVAKCGATVTPSASARSATGRYGVMPPIRAASGWITSSAPASRKRRWSLEADSISPLAMGVSSCARSAACPSTSYASSGSSIQTRSNSSRRRPIRRAAARSHCWLASTMSGTSGPSALRSCFTRATSALGSPPTLSLMPPIPRARLRSAFAMTVAMSLDKKPPPVS